MLVWIDSSWLTKVAIHCARDSMVRRSLCSIVTSTTSFVTKTIKNKPVSAKAHRNRVLISNLWLIKFIPQTTHRFYIERLTRDVFNLVSEMADMNVNNSCIAGKIVIPHSI